MNKGENKSLNYKYWLTIISQYILMKNNKYKINKRNYWLKKINWIKFVVIKNVKS